MHTSTFLNFFAMLLSVVLLAACAKDTHSPYQTDHTQLQIPDKLLKERTSRAKITPPSDEKLASNGMRSGFFLITPYANSLRQKHHYHTIYDSYLETQKRDVFPITYNERVQYFIDFFLENRRELFTTWLERAQVYIPDMLEILREEGIPDDIVYLPLIESGFNPHAVSPAYAVGQWQFIQATGKRYGLEINNWIDERKDWEKSTRAAAQYLSDLYEMFGNWELALAAYNCGEARVAREIAKHDSYDYWVISQSLPRETRNYVPVYLAALIIAKNPEKYGFSATYDIETIETVRVPVPPKKSLRDIAKVTGIDHKMLEELNPSLLNKATPPGSDYFLYVPKQHKQTVVAKRTQIASIDDISLQRSGSYVYTVRRGDSLWNIARNHRVSVANIRSTNNLRNDTIRPGQKLVIPGGVSPGIQRAGSYEYVVRPGDTLGHIAVNHGVSVDALRRYNGISGTFIKAGQKIKIPSTGNVISYRIKQGDTLWDIANRYSVTVADIKRWNSLESSVLRAGQDIKIYR